jgi:hypothetical protein
LHEREKTPPARAALTDNTGLNSAARDLTEGATGDGAGDAISEIKQEVGRGKKKGLVARAPLLQPFL